MLKLISRTLAEEFSIEQKYAQNIISLIDEGNTIPFIARYRKELTGHQDDQLLRRFADRLAYLRNLEKRKQEVASSIAEQGKMTEELQKKLGDAKTLTEVEDIYRPFKPKKRTRAMAAMEKGLKPLADTILEQEIKEGSVEEIAGGYVNEEKGVQSARQAVEGALDIIAEIISDDADLRKRLRSITMLNGAVASKMADSDREEAKTYLMYADFKEDVSTIPSHRILAINRAEGILKVKIELDRELAIRVVTSHFVRGDSIFRPLVEAACRDSYDRLIQPSIEREVRAALTERASEQAIKMFEVNLRPLLLQPPVKDKVVLGLDPAYRTGCKIAVVDVTGKVLDTAVIYPTPPQNRTEEANKVLKDLIYKHNVDVIAIGNGTASKEAEIFVAGAIKELDRKVMYAVVNEAGASVYSASKLAAEEFPDFDVSLRSAVSIARRLQDPLAELIKIDPKAIGVGQYQHDMPQARLNSVLAGVLEDCVSSVGVNLNTASAQLLTHVSGLNSAMAKNIVRFREQNGKFKSRAELFKVKRLGPKAFEQCAGFLLIPDGESVLDNTAVHPESYGAAEKLLSLFSYAEQDVEARKISDLPEKVKAMGEEEVARLCGVGVFTLRDIIGELLKPGRDIRDELPQPALRSDIMTIDDLREGMELLGTVRNVVDFGAFVDVGVHQDGLVHISELSERFVRHPSEIVEVGQQVKVRVIGVDRERNRISLSMKGVPKGA
jgi:uncharacterized protein